MKPVETFIRSGKVKDIYELDDDHLLFEFTDRVSAFDVVLPSTIPKKGEVLCKLSAYWFESLGVPHHMVGLQGSTGMVVKKMKMLMVECVARGYLYGSLYERLSKGEVTLPVAKILAAKLPAPYFDPTTKSDLKDEPITEAEIVRQGRMSPEELKGVREATISIYQRMSSRASEAGYILADLKLEFGKTKDGIILLGDSIGPDEFRIWPVNSYAPGRIQESYDKQPIRDWLISAGYKAKLDAARKNGGPIPDASELPEQLIEETSKRYVSIYEQLTGRSL